MKSEEFSLNKLSKKAYNTLVETEWHGIESYSKEDFISQLQEIEAIEGCSIQSINAVVKTITWTQLNTVDNEELTNEKLIKKCNKLMDIVQLQNEHWELQEFIPLYSEIIKRFEQYVKSSGCCKKE